MSDRTVNIWELEIDGYDNTPESLWKVALDYFLWCDTHPIRKPEMVRSGAKAGTTVYTDMPRPYTLKSFSVATNISEEFMRDMASNEANGEWYFAAKKILDIISVQKLENVIVGVYSPMVIIKEMNIGEKKNEEGMQNVTIEVQGNSPKLISNENEIDMKKQDFLNNGDILQIED